VKNDYGMILNGLEEPLKTTAEVNENLSAGLHKLLRKLAQETGRHCKCFFIQMSRYSAVVTAMFLPPRGSDFKDSVYSNNMRDLDELKAITSNIIFRNSTDGAATSVYNTLRRVQHAGAYFQNLS
jgi:hypothetical protein